MCANWRPAKRALHNEPAQGGRATTNSRSFSGRSRLGKGQDGPREPGAGVFREGDTGGTGYMADTRDDRATSEVLQRECVLWFSSYKRIKEEEEMGDPALAKPEKRARSLCGKAASVEAATGAASVSERPRRKRGSSGVRRGD